MTVVAAGNRYPKYCDKPDEPAALCAFPIVPFDGPLTLGGTGDPPFVPFNDYAGAKPALSRLLYVGVTGNLEVTLANDCVAAGIAYGAVSGNTINVPGHNFVTGDRVMVYGAGLPSGIAAQTAYYVIVADGNDIQLATSLANAQAGTAIALTAAAAGVFSVFKTTQIYAAAVGYHALCCQQVNAATTASHLVGLY
jgi:hypothetical protein